VTCCIPKKHGKALLCTTRAQSVWMLFIKDCYRPRLSPWMLLVQCTAFFVLCAGFFRQAYLQKGRARAAKAQLNGTGHDGVDRHKSA